MSEAGLRQRKGGKEEDKPPSIMSRAFSKDETWSHEDFFDLIHWVRQIIGLIAGLVCGFMGVQGAVGLISFGLANFVITLGYYSSVLGVDDEDFGGRWACTTEGFMPSLGTFVMFWIVLFNLMHV